MSAAATIRTAEHALAITDAIERARLTHAPPGRYVPSMRWLPVAICVVIVVVGAAVAIKQLDALADIRLEKTRTELPGSRTVKLDEGKYVVWNEARRRPRRRTPATES